LGNWNDIYNETLELEITRHRESPTDQVRRKYLAALHNLTNRNVVAYYSGWLYRPGPNFVALTSIGDDDKHGLMSCFKGFDWNKGLDLILHLPGGSIAATETIIDYIRSKFGDNVRTIVPQISMSGATMIACAGKQIVMGLHSNLGPIDPQFGSWPAIAVLKEFERAVSEIVVEPMRAAAWQPILSQYQPTLLSQAKHAIEWSREIGEKALKEGMLKGDGDKDRKAREIVDFLLSEDLHHAHGRHLHRKELQEKGLKIVELEADQQLQDAVLSVHHAFIGTLLNTNCVKIIENHEGIALVRNLVMAVPPVPSAPPPARPPQQQPPQAQRPQQDISFFRRLIWAIRFIFKL
jgi:ClpP class serine protease